ncbi:hypothetical protein FWH09_00170 [Candidatus Saccharibacteria bacterium]|nr:hypothetical protein [Candidatus Saccharibacteria bacterium]
MGEDKQKPIVPVPPTPPAVVRGVEKKQVSATARAIRTTCAWVVIISAALFAFVAILGIWGVFGTSTGDVVGKSLGSLFVIGFASGVIAIVSSLIADSRR